MNSDDGELAGLEGTNFHGAEAALRRAAHVAHRRAEATAKTGKPLAFGTMAVPGGRGGDPRKLSFSQAQGYEEIPGPLKLEELSYEARMGIWNLFYLYIGTSLNGIDVIGVWHDILASVYWKHNHRPLDEWSNWSKEVYEDLRRQIEEMPFNRVFDLIQFVMREEQCPPSFIEDMAGVFSEYRLAYIIDTSDLPTILPAVTKEEGETLVKSLQTLAHGGLQGSASHLRKSAECINRGDWAGSIRESVHAVESVARQLNPKATTLAPALKSLEAQGTLHPALKSALGKLYGYTSDEQGIRHAYLKTEQANVGMDEALFMLGACASFASYLWRKHTAGGNP